MKFTMLLILLLIHCIGQIRGDGVCGAWDSFKDEKCFGVLVEQGLQTFEAAKAICNKQGGTMVQITSAEEQEFLTKIIFTKNKVVDDVWIGLHKVANIFKWDLDNTDATFTNWAPGAPSNGAGEDCVQMLPKVSKLGKWDDERCTKSNRVVCQKYQIWTPAIVQATLLKERKQLGDLVNQLKNQQNVINAQANQINALKTSVANSIPIGFTYIQYPKEKAPTEIWPSLKWQEVSANYAGMFFRVNGGGSAAWGALQDDASPRLSRIQISNAVGYKDVGDPIAKGGLGKIKAGITGGPWYFQFEVSNTEVRPRNMAIRVWNRIG